MPRLIDADELLQGYEDHDFIDTHVIWNAPTVDAVPVRHGRWKDYPIADGCVQCSACGVIRMGEPSSYCPNCGAKMDREEE